ncbi:protein of unknown function [Desulfatibacillum alkenivorans DSM 16219]|jgi:hypothetical protein|uniref:DUF932 domain-containing protein n=1 Tax=Desulfatibacillum alkenivorans DSM 16219 TaxID=1121393 RepID=A0A1M6LP05_9BACT|nr:DUF932 domain-containing protein [Desulfatibacillum alkenivorans]SHJ72941.1 protein of unknown function [Desulfatibacillum alkenivorans DSM 16219]
MQTMTTMENAWNRVSELSQNCFDDLVPVKDIRFEGIDNMFIGEERHPVRTTAQRQIATRLGVPYSYLSKCDADLQTENLGYWLAREKNDEFFVRFDGTEVRALFTPRYQPVDNIRVMERLEQMGFGPDMKIQLALDAEFFSLSIPDHEKTFVVGNDDKLTPGITVCNSEVGRAALSIAAFVLRLVCTNGLIAKTAVSASYRHISAKVMEVFPETFQQVAGELDVQQTRFRLSMESQVENPSNTIHSFNRQFQLADPEIQAVDWAYPQEMENPATMFNVVNTYTKASQAPGLNAEASHRLGRVGGAILGMVK